MTDSRTHNPPVPSHNVRIEPEATSMSGEGQAGTAPRFALPVSTAVAIEAAIAALGFGIFVVWAWHDGGFAPEEYLPGGLLLLALLCTAAASSEVRARLTARPLPLVLFGLYVAWSFLSILWAQVPADALDGANRTLVYWLVFALFTGLGLSERVGSAVVLAWGLALAALGVIALIQTATATTSAGHFDQGRLAAPISYSDGDAALFLGACLPLVVLASRRQTRASLRLAACAGAVVLADLSVLSQSRGCARLVPVRARALPGGDPQQAAGACASRLVACRGRPRPAGPAARLLRAVVGGHAEQAAVRSALAWIAGSVCLAALGLGVLLLLERRVTLSRRARVLIGTSVAVLVGAVVVSGAVVVAGSHPLGRAERAWRDFTTNKAAAPTKTLHFTSGFGTSRYDVWRIALKQFAAHPVTGVGSDNFIVGYLRDRRTHETSRYPESVELRTFSETGIVGAAALSRLPRGRLLAGGARCAAVTAAGTRARLLRGRGLLGPPRLDRLVLGATRAHRGGTRPTGDRCGSDCGRTIARTEANRHPTQGRRRRGDRVDRGGGPRGSLGRRQPHRRSRGSRPGPELLLPARHRGDPEPVERAARACPGAPRRELREIVCRNAKPCSRHCVATPTTGTRISSSASSPAASTSRRSRGTELAQARRLSPQDLVVLLGPTSAALGRPAHRAPGRPRPPGGVNSPFGGVDGRESRPRFA